MCADIYTKAFTEATKWQAVCGLINIVGPRRLRQFVTDFSTDDEHDGNVDRSVSAGPQTPAMSSPFAPDPMRYDNTAHEDWPRHPPGKALELTWNFDHTNGVFKKPLQRGGITKTCSLSLSLSLSPVTI